MRLYVSTDPVLTDDIRVRMPHKLKHDAWAAAKREGMSGAEFVRSAILKALSEQAAA